MNFYGKAERLNDIDLPRIGSQIGVGEDEIHAVLDVEARGRGFDSQGRPAMLFEPHIFYRQLKGEERNEAVRQGLAYPKWRRNYPKDSYPRLLKAMRINEESALKSASWGMGQIMGFNHQTAGYDSAKEMVEAFLDSEAEHLQAMVTFILMSGLDDELRDHDWHGFARGYNGAGYKKNHYHTKLAASYKKWSNIPDTEWKREQAIVSTKTEPKELKPLTQSKEVLTGVGAAATAATGVLASTTGVAQVVVSVALSVALLAFGGFIIWNRVKARNRAER